jgi:hypothetical protein
MKAFVLAECVCGVVKVIAVGHLKDGRSKSCGCSRSSIATSGGDVPMPETVSVYGALITIGELASLAGRKTEYVWARIKSGKTPEEAAFGRVLLTHAPVVRTKTRKDIEAGRAIDDLKRWSEKWGRLRDHGQLALVFAAIEKTST